MVNKNEVWVVLSVGSEGGEKGINFNVYFREPNFSGWDLGENHTPHPRHRTYENPYIHNLLI